MSNVPAEQSPTAKTVLGQAVDVDWCDTLYETSKGMWYYCRLESGHAGEKHNCPAENQGK